MYLFFRYTANLAAHLTAKIPTTEFESIEDLSQQSIPLYIRQDKHDMHFFNMVHSDEFKKIIEFKQFWHKTPEISDHLQKGRAVFASQRSLDIIKKQNCSQTFRTFGQTGVSQKAFALRKNHPLLPNISRKILQYSSRGIITEIINRYKPQCSPTAKNSILPRSSLRNMKGLLAVTTSLVLFRGLAMIVECMLKQTRPHTSQRKSRSVTSASVG